MAISPIASSGVSGDQMPASTNTSSGTTSDPYAMSPADFINLMVTQLQNQDPTSPTSSQDLLNQVSQISQLESSTTLQSTMTTLTLQSQVGSASALIGKSVTGIDSNNNTSSGVVNSVSVAGGTVSLNLDSGTTMALTNLSTVQAAATTTTTPGT